MSKIELKNENAGAETPHYGAKLVQAELASVFPLSLAKQQRQARLQQLHLVHKFLLEARFRRSFADVSTGGWQYYQHRVALPVGTGRGRVEAQ